MASVNSNSFRGLVSNQVRLTHMHTTHLRLFYPCSQGGMRLAVPVRVRHITAFDISISGEKTYSTIFVFVTRAKSMSGSLLSRSLSPSSMARLTSGRCPLLANLSAPRRPRCKKGWLTRVVRSVIFEAFAQPFQLAEPQFVRHFFI